MLIEGRERIADGLVVAAELIGNLLRMQTALGREQDLAAAQREAGGGAQPSLERLLLLRCHIADINRSSHAA